LNGRIFCGTVFAFFYHGLIPGEEDMTKLQLEADKAETHPHGKKPPDDQRKPGQSLRGSTAPKERHRGRGYQDYESEFAVAECHRIRSCR
jgi:hypothetical protein